MLIGFVLGSNVLSVIVSSRATLKKYPLEAHTAKADAAETITNSAIALTASWEHRFNEVMDRVVKLEKHSADQDKLLTKMRRHLDKWAEWAEDMRRDWPLLRLQDRAPLPPDMKDEE
jgi:hypothetical protein